MVRVVSNVKRITQTSAHYGLFKTSIHGIISRLYKPMPPFKSHLIPSIINFNSIPPPKQYIIVMEGRVLYVHVLTLAIFCLSGAHAATFSFTNNCGYTVWPGTLTADNKPQLSSTGFKLSSKASTSLTATAPWTGRFWGRTGCTTDSTGKFSCSTGDCASGQVTCQGAGGNPPATLVEFTLAANNGQDFYDVSLVDGFNLPVSVIPLNGNNCKVPSCPADVNSVCPAKLAIIGSDGSVIACKSACLAFSEPQYCCTGNSSTAATCPATSYSMIFKNQCPLAYSYAYDDLTGTFTCTGGVDYLITFCP